MPGPHDSRTHFSPTHKNRYWIILPLHKIIWPSPQAISSQGEGFSLSLTHLCALGTPFFTSRLPLLLASSVYKFDDHGRHSRHHLTVHTLSFDHLSVFSFSLLVSKDDWTTKAFTLQGNKFQLGFAKELMKEKGMKIILFLYIRKYKLKPQFVII